MRPGGSRRLSASHDADVAARNVIRLLVGTAYPPGDAFRLTGRCDVVRPCDDGQQVRPDVTDVHGLAFENPGAVHQPVVTVQINNQLPERAAGHWNVVGHPGIHGMPGLHYFCVVEIIK